MTTLDEQIGVDLTGVRRPPRRRPVVATCLLALALVSGITGISVTTLVDERRDSLHTNQSARMEALARGRAAIVATWLDGIAQAGRRLTESDLVRLFAGELATGNPTARPGLPVADQVAYFDGMIADFVGQNGLVAAALVAPDGRYLLGEGKLPATDLDQRIATERGYGILPARPGTVSDATLPGAALVLDLILPVLPPAPVAPDPRPAPAAYLVLTVPLADQLASLLDVGPLLAVGERFRLIQQQGDTVEQVIPGSDARVTPIAGGGPVAPGEARGYGLVTRSDGNDAYVVAAAVSGLPWTVVHEIDARLAHAPLQTFTLTALVFAGLGGLLLVSVFVVFWLQRNSTHHLEMAQQYRQLASRVQSQRRLLQGITDAMQELLTVKTPDGRYSYVNPAFARAVDRPVEAVLGQTDADLFGDEVAGAIGASDRRALDGLPVVAEASTLELTGQVRHLSTSKVGLDDVDGRITGVVAVSRDVTELVAERQKHERLIQQTVDALIRAIELRDPFLLGHSRRLQRYAVAVGLRLGLDDRELATLDFAACLSQVGKIFVPDEILTKPGRHSDAEMRVMRSHIAHAIEVVAPIEFDLPIAAVIGQMYERLDGSGYPSGLEGDQIGLLARILGVVDVFCALTEPRAYRDQMSAGKALYHLAESRHLYDIAIVSTLTDLVAEEAGDLLGGEPEPEQLGTTAA